MLGQNGMYRCSNEMVKISCTGPIIERKGHNWAIVLEKPFNFERKRWGGGGLHQKKRKGSWNGTIEPACEEGKNRVERTQIVPHPNQKKLL